MKKLNYLSLAAIATFGLASCSSDEPYNGSNDQNVAGEQYLAVTIRTAGMGGTRAPEVGDPEFEPAVGDEGKITADNLYFFFFDDNDNPFQLAAANVDGAVSTNMVKPTRIETVQNNGQEPEIQGVLVLGKAAGEGYVGTHPTKMICVANPATDNIGQYANKPLDQVLGVKSVNASLPALDNFVMTSSTYVENGEKVVATNVKDKFFTDPDDAKSNPATIYLERLAVKVRANGLKEYTPQYKKADGTIVSNYEWKVNNAVADLQVVLNGWRLTNISTQSLAFKNVSAAGNYFENWNNASLHRCYWALSDVSATLKNPLGKEFINIYDDKQWTCGNFDADPKNIKYAYENTQSNNGQKVTDRTTNATGIIVKATVQMKGADNTYAPVNLTRWAGAYYTEDVLKQMIVDNYNVVNKTNLTASAVTFSEAGNNKWYAVVANQPWNTDYNNISRWIGGATSYYLNIQHLGNLFGVVRNHIYDYTFTNVIGLGVPGNDPQNPEDEEENFLAARIAILNWHVVSNKFVLE